MVSEVSWFVRVMATMLLQTGLLYEGAPLSPACMLMICDFLRLSFPFVPVFS